MTEQTCHNVFISHIHKHDEELHALTDLLKNNGYEIKDASIDSRKPNNTKNPEYIKAEILAPRIRWAGCFIVLIGKGTSDSEYVAWEIEYAKREGKRIVGVFVRGATDADIPYALERYGDALVGWNTDRVMGAVKGEHN
ncbi:MAG: TIR domain-containing protein [Deltaproteobacteria bacterium]|nr:TIR domain-containing protein [Deltaproteobacteria bacterium]